MARTIASIVYVQLDSILQCVFFFVQLSSAMLFYWSTSGWVGCLLLHIHFFHNSNCRDCYILRGADLFFQISFTINYRHKTPTLCVVAKSGLLHKFNKSWSLCFFCICSPTNPDRNSSFVFSNENSASCIR